MSAGLADVYGQWLDQLASADPADAGPPPSLADVVGQLEDVDPRMRGLLRYFALREQEDAAEVVPEVEDSVAPEQPAPTNGTGDVDVPDVLRRLSAELVALRARNDELADALGACYLCWGEDPACDHCGGRGRPGSRRPDAEPFVRWVAPAVKRLRAAQRPDTVAPVRAGDDARPERRTDE